jgi:hypothetical protein
VVPIDFVTSVVLRCTVQKGKKQSKAVASKRYTKEEENGHEENCRSRVMHLIKSSYLFLRPEPRLSGISFQIVSSLVVVSFCFFSRLTPASHQVLCNRDVRHVSPIKHHVLCACRLFL